LVGTALGPAHHVRLSRYKRAGNRTFSTADLRRSPRVQNRWFDSTRLAGRFANSLLESNTISTQDITRGWQVALRTRHDPVLARQYRLRVCAPKAEWPRSPRDRRGSTSQGLCTNDHDHPVIVPSVSAKGLCTKGHDHPVIVEREYRSRSVYQRPRSPRDRSVSIG